MKQELIWLWEDLIEGIAEAAATTKYRWQMSRELKKYECTKFVDPVTSFKITLATIILYIITFSIIAALFSWSTQTYYERERYGYDTVTQGLIKLDEEE